MKLKLRLLYRLIQIALLFSYGVMIAGLVFPLLGLLFPESQYQRLSGELKTHWLRCFSAILNLRVNQEGVLPDQGTMLVSNHISWLDIIVIGQFLPAYFVAKSDISGWPVIGFLAKQGGTVFIRRGDKQQIKATSEQMLGLLKQNSTIIAFPEGTTTAGQDVQHFHASLFQPALMAQSAIQAAVVQYQGEARVQAPFIGDDEFVSHLLKMLALDKIEVSLSFLPVIDSAGKSRQTVSLETRELIAQRIAEG
ncbi:MAG: lysophospholipid acyltransferase family protein [Methylococcales bacterium]|nr:lysophospholipid acyltransferase family protein [Methylococcales bacterium]